MLLIVNWLLLVNLKVNAPPSSSVAYTVRTGVPVYAKRTQLLEASSAIIIANQLKVFV